MVINRILIIQVILCVIYLNSSYASTPTLAQRSEKSKLEQYEKLYKQYRYSNSDSALYYLTKQLELAEALRELKIAGKAHLRSAKIYRSKGNYNQAIDNNLDAAYVFKKLNEYLYYADALNNLGYIVFSAGDYGNAYTFFDRASVIYDYYNDTTNVILSNINKGVCQLEIDNYDLSKIHYLKALTWAKSSRDDLLVYDVCNHIGELEQRQCHYKESRDFYGHALKAVVDLPNSLFLKATINSNIGETFLLEGHLDSAKLFLSKTTRLSKEELLVDNLGTIANLNLGQLYLKKNQINTARTHFERAIALADGQTVNRPLTKTLNQLNYAHNLINQAGGKIDMGSKIAYDEIWNEQHDMLWDLKNKLQSANIQQILFHKIQLKETTTKLAAVNRVNNINIAMLVIIGVLFLGAVYFFWQSYSKVRKVKKVLARHRLTNL